MTYSKEERRRPTTTITLPKVTVATSTMPKVTVSANSISTNEGRSRPDTEIVMPKVAVPSTSINASAESPSFWERAKDTALGGAGKSLASGINMVTNLIEQRQEREAAMWDELLSADGFQGKYDTISALEDAQRGTTKAAYELADNLKSSAEARIDHAKEGLGTPGQVLVDVGVNGVQMGLDAATGALLFGEPSVLTYAGRKYGEHTQSARQDGADLEEASRYGLKGAMADAAIEKAFDGLNGIYGKAATTSLVEKFKNITDNPQMQKIIVAAVNDAGEVFESFVTDLADQLLKASYNDKSIGQTISETEWGRVGRNMLINAIIGLFQEIQRLNRLNDRESFIYLLRYRFLCSLFHGAKRMR